MAENVLERVSKQNIRRLEKTAATNNLILRLLAIAVEKDDPKASRIHLDTISGTKGLVITSNGMNSEPNQSFPNLNHLLKLVQPCMLLESRGDEIKFGRHDLIIDLPISPIEAMSAIAQAAEAFPKLQPPIRA